MDRAHPWELIDAFSQRVQSLISMRPARPKGGRPFEDDRLEKVKQ